MPHYYREHDHGSRICSFLCSYVYYPPYIKDQIAKGKKYVLVLKKIGPNCGYTE